MNPPIPKRPGVLFWGRVFNAFFLILNLNAKNFCFPKFEKMKKIKKNKVLESPSLLKNFPSGREAVKKGG